MKVLLIIFSTLGIHDTYYYIHSEYIYRYVQWYDKTDTDPKEQYLNGNIIIDICGDKAIKVSDDYSLHSDLDTVSIKQSGVEPQLKIQGNEYDLNITNYQGYPAIIRYIQAERLDFNLAGIQVIANISMLDNYLSRNKQKKYLHFWKESPLDSFNHMIAFKYRSLNQDKTEEITNTIEELKEIYEIEVDSNFFSSKLPKKYR